MEYYISHHGIEGQKWGVQNGPPYPLNPSDMSSYEKRLAKKEARGISKTLNRLSKHSKHYDREAKVAKKEYKKAEDDIHTITKPLRSIQNTPLRGIGYRRALREAVDQRVEPYRQKSIASLNKYYENTKVATEMKAKIEGLIANANMRGFKVTSRPSVSFDNRGPYIRSKYKVK